MAGRKPRGDEPMTRRNIHLPDKLWEALQEYADELMEYEGKPVSAAEALRRIVERSLKRRST